MGNYRIRMIDTESTAEWNSIVCSFGKHDVYGLNGYARAFQIHGDGVPVLFYYEDSGLRGFNVVMKRDIADDPAFAGRIPAKEWFDLCTPYGYGGWILEGSEDTSQLDAAYSDLCREKKIVSEFVRFHPVVNNAKRMNRVYQLVNLGHTIAMDLTDADTIWQNITSKNRNMIRKAKKNEITIVQGDKREDYANFKRMYDETMKKDQAERYYFFEEEFYDSIRRDLSGNAQVFTAMYKGKPIAAAIMIYTNGRLNYHLSGSDIAYRSLAPTNLLLYQAALWGCENGMRTFHLGGGIGSEEDSLYKFKRAFYRGEPKEFAIGKKIFLPDVYEMLDEYRIGAPESSFFPEYRRPGSAHQ